MNGSGVLEDRLREAFARRAAATSVGEPRGTTIVDLVPSSTPPLHRGRRRVAIGAGIVAAAAALVWVVALDDGDGGVSDRTSPAPMTTEGTADPTAGAPPGMLVQYEPTTLPTGYAPMTRDDIGGDVADEIIPQRFGVNCLDWQFDGEALACHRLAAVRTRHYGRPHTNAGVTVATFVNVPFAVIPETGTEPATVQGSPAHVRPGTSTTGARLYWEAEPGVTVVVDGLDPVVTDDELFTIANGLRPTEVPARSDGAFAVVQLDLPRGGEPGTGTRTAYLWARPGSEHCVGALLDNLMLPCQPVGDVGALQSVGNTRSAAIGGSVTSTVAQVYIETVEGDPIEAELVEPGAPFEQRYFLTPIGTLRPTAVVALDAEGNEVARQSLSPPLP